jgi:hypothetical protein
MSLSLFLTGLLPSRAPLCFGCAAKVATKIISPGIRHQIFSLQFDPLNNKLLFSACKLTYTPDKGCFFHGMSVCFIVVGKGKHKMYLSTFHFHL